MARSAAWRPSAGPPRAARAAIDQLRAAISLAGVSRSCSSSSCSSSSCLLPAACRWSCPWMPRRWPRGLCPSLLGARAVDRLRFEDVVQFLQELEWPPFAADRPASSCGDQRGQGVPKVGEVDWVGKTSPATSACGILLLWLPYGLLPGSNASRADLRPPPAQLPRPPTSSALWPSPCNHRLVLRLRPRQRVQNVVARGGGSFAYFRLFESAHPVRDGSATCATQSHDSLSLARCRRRRRTRTATAASEAPRSTGCAPCPRDPLFRHRPSHPCNRSNADRWR